MSLKVVCDGKDCLPEEENYFKVVKATDVKNSWTIKIETDKEKFAGNHTITLIAVEDSLGIKSSVNETISVIIVDPCANQ